MKSKGTNRTKKDKKPQSTSPGQNGNWAVFDLREMESPNFCVFHLVSRLFWPSVEEAIRGTKVLEKLDDHLDELNAKAKQGNLESLKELFYTAYQSTVAIQEVIQNDPTHIREIAKKVPIWPVLAYRTGSVNKAQVAMFNSLELGAEVQVCDASRMLHQSTTFRKWAFCLLEIIERMRKSLRYQRHLQKQQRTFLVHTDKSILIPADLLEAVDRLPDFSSNGAQFKLWCDSVEHLFKVLTNDQYHEIPILWKQVETMLKGLVSHGRFDQGSTEEKNYGRSEILNRLRKAVEVASKSSRHCS